MTTVYNLAIATDYPYDRDFIDILERECQQLGLSTFIIRPENLQETLYNIAQGALAFNYLYDRASDTDFSFLKIYEYLNHAGTQFFHSLENLHRAVNKITMHYEFIRHGIITPYTIVIPAVHDSDELPLQAADLQKIGCPFVMKPSQTTGGGIGVVKNVYTLEEVYLIRNEFKDNPYLLQEFIHPIIKDGKRFWFRVFYICEEIICTWWNDLTHIYHTTTENELATYNLEPIFSIMQTSAKVTGLHFFSSEIALTAKGDFVVVDYVNEICDMRLKSKTTDGVPDEVVYKIAKKMAAFIKEQIC